MRMPACVRVCFNRKWCISVTVRVPGCDCVCDSVNVCVGVCVREKVRVWVQASVCDFVSVFEVI